MGGCLGGWVGQWVGSCQIIKNQVNCHLIEIIEFCLKIYDLWRQIMAHDVCMAYCVGQWVGSCQITRNSIIRKLIKIIQFCLKVFVFCLHSYPIPLTQPPIPLDYTQISNNSIIDIGYTCSVPWPRLCTSYTL